MSKLTGYNKDGIDSVYAAMASDTSLKMAISNYKLGINKGLQVVAAVIDRMPESLEELNDAFNAIADKRASIVPETATFHSVGPRGDQIGVRFVAASFLENRPFNDESVKGMKLVTANVFMEGEQVWNVVGEGDTKRLVQSNPDDLDEILSSRRRYLGIASLESVINVPVQNGDFIAYVTDDGLNQVRSGYAVKVEGGLKVADLNSGVDVIVAETQVIEAADGMELADEKVTDGQTEVVPLNVINAPVEGNLSAENADKVLNYARKVYGDHPAFYSKLSSLVRGWQGKKQEIFTSPQLSQTVTRSMR